MIARTRGRCWAALGTAVGGVLVGHQLAYIAVASTGTNGFLRDTGHDYLASVNDVGLVVALAALAFVFLGRLSVPSDPVPTLGRVSARVIPFQIGTFVSMEVLERVTSGSPLGTLMQHGLLPIGVAIQIGVGLVASGLLLLLMRAGERVASLLAEGLPIVPRRSIAVRRLPTTARVDRLAVVATGIRGPPSSAA
jgi:hypothetical protein